MSNRNSNLLSMLGAAAIGWLAVRVLIGQMPSAGFPPFVAASGSAIAVDGLSLDPEMLRVAIEYFKYLRRVLDVVAGVKAIHTVWQWLKAALQAIKVWWNRESDPGPPAPPCA